MVCWRGDETSPFGTSPLQPFFFSICLSQEGSRLKVIPHPSQPWFLYTKTAGFRAVLMVVKPERRSCRFGRVGRRFLFLLRSSAFGAFDSSCEPELERRGEPKPKEEAGSRGLLMSGSKQLERGWGTFEPNSVRIAQKSRPRDHLVVGLRPSA